MRNATSGSLFLSEGQILMEPTARLVSAEHTTLLPLPAEQEKMQTFLSTNDAQLIERLRGGDEKTFTQLVDMYSASMLRLARIYIDSHSVAEEVVQETWLGALQGLPAFEGRSTFKTWLFRILSNQAKTRAEREGRSVPFSALKGLDEELGEPTVDPACFRGPDQPYTGGWISPPSDWHEVPEERMLSQETYDCIINTVGTLPASQHAVILMRDIEGWSTEEVCEVLGLTLANQRVLLHRARAKVRRALEKYFAGE